MKSQKIPWPWGLGPRNYILTTWAEKAYQSISPEPWLQFSQTQPHFLQNHESLDESNIIMKSQKIYWGLGPRNYIWVGSLGQANLSKNERSDSISFALSASNFLDLAL